MIFSRFSRIFKNYTNSFSCWLVMVVTRIFTSHLCCVRNKLLCMIRNQYAAILYNMSKAFWEWIRDKKIFVLVHLATQSYDYSRKLTCTFNETRHYAQCSLFSVWLGFAFVDQLLTYAKFRGFTDLGSCLQGYKLKMSNLANIT